jgi:hypothetical protein
MITMLAPNCHVYKHHASLSHQMLTCVSHYYHDMGTRCGGWILALLALIMQLVLFDGKGQERARLASRHASRLSSEVTLNVYLQCVYIHEGLRWNVLFIIDHVRTKKWPPEVARSGPQTEARLKEPPVVAKDASLLNGTNRSFQQAGEIRFGLPTASVAIAKSDGQGKEGGAGGRGKTDDRGGGEDGACADSLQNW